MVETKYTKEYTDKLQKDAVAKLHRCGVTDRDDLVADAARLGYWSNIELLIGLADEVVDAGILGETLFEV